MKGVSLPACRSSPDSGSSATAPTSLVINMWRIPFPGIKVQFYNLPA